MSHESCSVALCPDPLDIDNGTVTNTGNSVNDTATYSCDLGFELMGSANTTCTLVTSYSAVFSPQPPFCSREYCMNINRVDTSLLIDRTGVHIEERHTNKRAHEERLHYNSAHMRAMLLCGNRLIGTKEQCP